MLPLRREKSDGQPVTSKQKENDGTDVGREQKQIEWKVEMAHEKCENVREDREPRMALNESSVHRKERWIHFFLDAGDIDCRVLRVGMIAMHQKDEEGKADKRHGPEYRRADSTRPRGTRGRGDRSRNRQNCSSGQWTLED